MHSRILMKYLFAMLIVFLGFDSYAKGHKFTIFAPEMSQEQALGLCEIIRSGKEDTFEVEEKFKRAVKAKTDVLILFMDRRSAFIPDSKTIQALREKRIIGIGYGAAKIFGNMGLEIEGGQCMHFNEKTIPKIQIGTVVEGSQQTGQEILAFQRVENEKRKPDIDQYFAMHLPRVDENAQFVQAIARSNDNYAPIVKQGNCIMVGLAASPAIWTEEYKSFFSEMADWLAEQDIAPFSRAKWEITEPGEYKLTEGRKFYFQFPKRTDFSATLEHTGSSSVMFLFMGENREHWTRKDAKNGETLHIEAEIDRQDIRDVGDGYWILKVTSFDRGGNFKGTLKIDY